MFDFSWSEHTLGNVLYCAIIYVLFIAVFYKRCVTNALSLSSKPNKWLFLASLLLVITACIGTDWFHYRDMVINYDFTSGAFNYGEPVYRYIVAAVNRSYFLFRLVVWGSALFLTCIAFKRFGINLNVALFFLIAVFLIKFNYARGTLGMACYFVGLSYILKPNKGLFVLNLALAALFIWGAYVFHHSMLLLVLLTPVVIVLPLDKPFILAVVLLAFPFLASVIDSNFLLIDQLENEYIADRFSRYMEREGTEINFWGIIENLFNYGVFVIMITFDSVILVKNRRMVSAPIRRLYRVAISIVVFSVSFLFMGVESNVFFYRVLYMSFIPLTIITVSLFEQQLMSRKQYVVTLLWGIAAITWVLLHLIYKNL